MGKTLAQVNNTTIKVLVDMIDIGQKGLNEQLTRAKSYMIESQSSGISAGWALEDGEHVKKNLKAACEAFSTLTASMINVVDKAQGMQVDGDQVSINGYTKGEVSPDTT